MKTLISFDIQPEYKKYIYFGIDEWVKYINRESNHYNMIIMYNGYDTLGMIKQDEYIDWLLDIGIKESIIDYAQFVDKGYGYIFDCHGKIDDSLLVTMLKVAYKNDGKVRIDNNSILNEFYDDYLYMPSFWEKLKYIGKKVLVCGGAEEACLWELCITLKAMGKQVEKIKGFIYQ